MRSGSTSVVASAWLSGFDGSRLWFGAVWRSCGRWRARWRPQASGLLGVFWTGLGVAPCGGGWLGIGARWWRRWLGGQARRAVWHAGLLGCCGCCRCRCVKAFGVARGVCARGWAWGDVSQASAFWSRLLEGLPQAPEDKWVVLGCREVAEGGLPGGGAHRPAWLPMRHETSTPPPPAGGGGSPPTPCGAGGPAPRGRALPGPTFAAPRAACGSSAATTVPGRGSGLGRRSGRGRVCRRRCYQKAKAGMSTNGYR